MIRVNAIHASGLISRKCNVPIVPGYFTSIARYDHHDRLMGGCLYVDFNHASVHMHVASFQPNWVNRSLLYACFHHPFEVLNVNKILALVPETNKSSLVFTMHIGFAIEHLVKDVFSDGGMFVLGMYKSQCKYLTKPKSQSRATSESNSWTPTHSPSMTLQ